MLKLEISSILKFTGDVQPLLAYRERVQELYKEFSEDVAPGVLEGFLQGEEIGNRTLTLPRGFSYTGTIDAVVDKTNNGNVMNLSIDESKIDDRRVYQMPVVEKATQSTGGVIVSPTGSGKTVIINMLLAALRRTALILTQSTDIADQIRASIRNLLGIEPGWVGMGQRDVKPITVGMVQSIRSTDPLLQQFGVLIIDEAHHVSSRTHMAILNKCTARYRYGLTATIRKTDASQKLIFAALGPVLCEIKVKELQEAGHLNQGKLRPIYTQAIATKLSYVSNKCWYYKAVEKQEGRPCPVPCTYPVDNKIDHCVYDRGYSTWVYQQLSRDVVRNRQIFDATKSVVEGHPWTMVMTHLVEHAVLLAEQLKPAGKVFAAHGSPMKKKQRKENIAAFNEQGGILVCTSKAFGEGFNSPRISCLVRAMPSGGMVTVRQQTGRIMRPQPIESLIIDFVDHRIVWLKRLWFGRKSICKSIGFTVEDQPPPDLFA